MVQERRRLSDGGLHGPDRDNLAVILSLAAFVRDSLDGAPAELLERRLANLRSATDAAVDLGALPELVRPTVDDLVRRLQAATDARHAAEDARFSAAVASMAQREDDIPAESARPAAGAEGRSMVERIWGSLSPRTAE